MATKVKPRPKAAAPSATEKLLAATEQKPKGKNETGNAFFNRLCSAISELDDDTYNALDPDALNWAEVAIKNLSLKTPRPDKVPDLDGVSAMDGVDTEDDEAAEDDDVAEDDETLEEEPAEEDEEPAPPPKRTAKVAVVKAAKPVRKAASKKPEPEEEDPGEEDDDTADDEPAEDEDEAPAPAPKAAKKGKAAAAAAPAPEVKRGRGRPRKDEATATTAKVKPTAKKKANGVTRARGSGGTYIVAELVTKYPEHSLDQIKAMAAKRGSTVADSQVAQVRRFTQTIVSILKNNDMYKPPKAAK